MDQYSLYHDELVKFNYYPNVMAYYYRQWDEFHMPFHHHKEIEIMYVISGKCVVDVEGNTSAGAEKEKASFALKKGEFILLDANVPHRLTVEAGSPCRMLNIEFHMSHREGVGPSFQSLVEGSPILAVFLELKSPYIVLRDSDEVYHTLKSLVLELDERSGGNDMMVQLQFGQLLILIARLAMKAKDNGLNQADLYVKKVMEYIQHHYDCTIQVKDIAAVVNLHPAYLQRIFKNNIGCTVMEYLTTFRMEKAQMLLSYSNIPIIEISDYIGISSSQYFSAVFKKHTNKTPLEYRKSTLLSTWDKDNG